MSDGKSFTYITVVSLRKIRGDMIYARFARDGFGGGDRFPAARGSQNAANLRSIRLHLQCAPRFFELPAATRVAAPKAPRAEFAKNRANKSALKLTRRASCVRVFV